jgi:manganese/zinc/iron transport system ATP- binding protein
MSAILNIHDLSVSYGEKVALKELSLDLPESQIIGVIGPNGSGKTSFLKSILGLIKLESGTVLYRGQEVSKMLDYISYVPQRESIDWNFPASVMDVVLMGRYSKKSLFKRSTTEDRRKAIEAIEKVGLLDVKDRQIGQLSGGQQQRTLVARALSRDADLLLLDEPFAGVDASTENTLLELFKTMSSEGKSLLIVHHDLYAVKSYFDYILLLKNELIAQGPVKEVLTQETLAKAYGGIMSFLDKE